MAEVIGIASGLLAILQATAQSAVWLYQAIESYKSQPKEVHDLQTQLKSLQEVLLSLQIQVGNEEAGNAASKRFEPVRVPLFSCYKCCEELQESFQATFKHTQAGGRSLRDWTRARFREKSFAEIQGRLEILKSTLVISIEVVQLQDGKATQEAIDSLEELVKDTKTDLSNILEDIKDVLNSKDAADKKSLEEDKQLLQKCLELCATAEKMAKDRPNIVAENVTADFGAIQTLGGDRNDIAANMSFKNISAGRSSKQLVGSFSPESLRAHLNTQVSPAEVLLEHQRARPQPEASAEMQYLLRQKAAGPPPPAYKKDDDLSKQ